MNKKIVHTCPERMPQFSRRQGLCTIAAGVALSFVPKSLSAGVPDDRRIVAAVFDGASLLFAGQNLSRSDDDGMTWTTLPAQNAGSILSLATHPARPGRILAGLASGGTSLSNDGGHRWETRASGLPVGAVLAISVASDQPDTVYAAVKGDGLWKSEDAGLTWVLVMDRPWLEDAERDPLALASVDLATGMGGIWIYAGTETGLTRVPDCFCRWQGVKPGNAMNALVSGDAPPPEFPLPPGAAILALVSAPSAPETLYAALQSGLWTSQDAGVVWSRLVEEAASAVAVHPTSANHIAAAFDSGLKQSRDGGVDWTAISIT